jgi:hypothetical protein
MDVNPDESPQVSAGLTTSRQRNKWFGLSLAEWLLIGGIPGAADGTGSSAGRG